jgi:hypothetical protein
MAIAETLRLLRGVITHNFQIIIYAETVYKIEIGGISQYAYATRPTGTARKLIGAK